MTNRECRSEKCTGSTTHSPLDARNPAITSSTPANTQITTRVLPCTKPPSSTITGAIEATLA